MDSKYMQDLRGTIDEIDTKILALLGQRVKCTHAIGTYKKEQNLSVIQGQRWQEILSARIRTGKEDGLSEGFVSTILHAIHDESVRIQNEILKE